MRMSRTDAARLWDAHVQATAESWSQQFGETPVSEDWLREGFAVIADEVLEALALEDAWRVFHGAVQAYD